MPDHLAGFAALLSVADVGAQIADPLNADGWDSLLGNLCRDEFFRQRVNDC